MSFRKSRCGGGGVKKRPHPSGGVWIFSGIPYLFTHKPTLAISRDPKLVRHDSGSKVLEKNQKNTGYKPRPKFLNKKLLERSFKKPSLAGNMSKVIV